MENYAFKRKMLTDLILNYLLGETPLQTLYVCVQNTDETRVGVCVCVCL